MVVVIPTRITVDAMQFCLSKHSQGKKAHDEISFYAKKTIQEKASG